MTLSERVIEFLRGLVEDTDAERDARISDELVAEILATWPRAESGWTMARDGLATAITRAFETEVHRWVELLDAVGTYLNGVDADAEHPRVDQKFGLRRAGQPVHRVRFELDGAVARALLATATQDARCQFYSEIKEWSVWDVVANALDAVDLALSADEVVVLVDAAVDFATGDGAFSDLIERVLRGLRGSAEAVRAAVGAWAEGSNVSGRPTTYRLLTEDLLRAPGSDSELRDAVVRRLLEVPGHRFDALTVALHAWPDDTAWSERVAKFDEVFELVGPEGASDALQVLARAAGSTPGQVLEARDRVIGSFGEMPDEVVYSDLRLLSAVGHATRWSGDPVGPADALSRLPPPERLAPALARELDSALRFVAPRDPDGAKQYLLNWGSAHIDAIESQPELRSFSHVFPLSSGPIGDTQWLVAALFRSPRVGDRRLALRWLFDPLSPSAVHAGYGYIPTPALSIEDVAPERVLGVLNLLLGDHRIGAESVEFIVDIARARPDAVADHLELVASAVHRYPGRYRDCLGRWRADVGADGTVDSKVVTALTEDLATRERAFDLRGQLAPLFRASKQVGAAMDQLIERNMREEMETANRGSFLQSMMTRVPLACGRATTWQDSDDSERLTELKEISVGGEFPARSSYDPVSDRLQRVLHLQAANAALNMAPEASSGE